METTATVTDAGAYREVVREQGAWTTRLEKRLLARLARALPEGVLPDHLTALGFAGMLLTGAAYALSGRNPLFLHAANLGLLVNWFGDSLDGTLARHRARLRPRYGFYVDHVVDAFGVTAVLGGLAASRLMAPGVAACVLVAYLLLSVHLYLQTTVLGRFRMSVAGVGGTELRLALAAMNMAALAWPVLEVGGATVRLLDAIGVAGALALAIALVVSVASTTRELYRLERV
ncbi:MAG: CDP-alcohol phosphatidyltransferase family protein [Vicinamibacteria bacterium]